MKSKLAFLIYISLVALLLAGCAGNSTTYQQTSRYYFKGKQAYQNGKWIKAIDNLKLFILNNPGSEYADSAQYLLGESYFNNKEYLMAISEYSQLKNRYSYSPLVEKGAYKIAKSYVELSPNYHLDQENTRKAIRNCQSFISNYPNSEYVDEVEQNIQDMRNKLGHKMYTSGVLYRKMHRWEAAVIYFDNTLNQYYDTKYALDAKLEKAYCLIKLRKFEDYRELIASIEQEHQKNKELKNELASLKQTYQDEQKEVKKELEKSKGRF
ncbi:MAG: outer membrane protein assembly factor BamD [Candidatus Marinimicrobia bacterium]|nr:outer membrane protein assembly factor BamD [Candidatus Neomarinimicrobiota bacterium]